MPVYEYYCKDCQDSIDVTHSMSETPVVVCSACSGTRIKKLTLGGTIFRGTGWGGNR